MRILRAIIEPTANLVTVGVADLFHRCGIRAKPVGDDALGSAIFLHDALQKLERRSLVPLRGSRRAPHRNRPREAVGEDGRSDALLDAGDRCGNSMRKDQLGAFSLRPTTDASAA